MDINHDVINSLVLIALTVAYFIQNNKLKIIKTITDSYQPEKLKQAQDYIEKGNEHKFNLELSKQRGEITKETADMFKEVNKSFLDSYDELLNLPFHIMKDNSWERKRKVLERFS